MVTTIFLILTASVLRFTQPITKIGSSSIRTIDKQFAGSRYEMKGLIVLLFNIKGQNKPNLFVTAMLLQNELAKVVRLFFYANYLFDNSWFLFQKITFITIYNIYGI